LTQKELCLHRRTRDEKIKSLQDAQTKYKSESVSLDQQNNEMRKKLRALTVTMQSAGVDLDRQLNEIFIARNQSASIQTPNLTSKLSSSSASISFFFPCRAGQRLAAGPTEEGKEEIRNP
jgi:hypothetical protein